MTTWRIQKENSSPSTTVTVWTKDRAELHHWVRPMAPLRLVALTVRLLSHFHARVLLPASLYLVHAGGVCVGVWVCWVCARVCRIERDTESARAPARERAKHKVTHSCTLVRLIFRVLWKSEHTARENCIIERQFDQRFSCSSLCIVHKDLSRVQYVLSKYNTIKI